MKNRKLSFAFVFLLALAACNKNDLEVVPSPHPVVNASDWKSDLRWTTEEDSSTYKASIADELITSSVVSKGLVLVYKNEGGTITPLPVTKNGDTWYYQVSEGSIDVLLTTASRPAENVGYRYLIVTPEMLDKLEKQQHSRDELVMLSYEEALSLLK